MTPRLTRRSLLRGAAALAGGACLGPGTAGAITTGQPRIAMVIDDIGFSRGAVRRFLDLDLPLSFAILPRLALTDDLAHEVHEAGHAILLHQPMEAVSRRNDPGPGALYVSDGAGDISRTVARNIAGLPFAVGVNNHMGSRFTAHRAGMTAALETVRDHRLFFLDSRTSSRSTAYRTAHALGVPAVGRDVFLDNVQTTQAVTRQLETLAERARRHGSAVGIGHPHAVTARAIGRFAESLARRGSEIEIVGVPRLLRGPSWPRSGNGNPSPDR